MMNAPHSDATPADATPRSGGGALRTPFRGTRIATGIPLAGSAGYLDERATFMGQVRRELGIGAQDPADIEDFFRLGYRGARYSFGYPACPDLADRAKVARLLRPAGIGVELTEEMQLVPEQSADALVVHHPEAKYFST
jgi:hypothetical protein